MKKALLLAALLSAFAAPSFAQSATQATGRYAELVFAGALNQDSDVKGLQNGGAALPASIDFDNSFLAEAVLGHDFGLLRVDGSLGYMSTDINKSTAGGTDYRGAGNLFIIPLFLSGYLDIPTNGAVKPFIGAGAGLAWVGLDIPKNGTAFGSDDGTIVPAYHVTVGTGYQINPQLSLTASYRYMQTGEGSFDSSSNVAGASDKAKFDFSSNLVRFGFRIAF